MIVWKIFSLADSIISYLFRCDTGERNFYFPDMFIQVICELLCKFRWEISLKTYYIFGKE